MSDKQSEYQLAIALLEAVRCQECKGAGHVYHAEIGDDEHCPECRGSGLKGGSVSVSIEIKP